MPKPSTKRRIFTRDSIVIVSVIYLLLLAFYLILATGPLVALSLKTYLTAKEVTPLFWITLSPFFAFPLVLFISLIFMFVFFKRKKFNYSLVTALIPMLNLLIIALILNY